MFLNFEIDTISLLLPLALILLLSKLLQMGCKKIKMPQVVGMLLAGIIIASLPMIILFLCMSKQFVRGLTAGAVKG